MIADQTVDRIPLQRSVAVVTEGAITVRPASAQLLGAAIELLIAVLAVALLVGLFDRLPLPVLMGLLLLALFLGPVGILGLVYGAVGSSFVMERAKQTARWQQGFLGMGIGTTEVAPFDQIARIEVGGDFDLELTAGERQDLVHWDVRLVKASERAITVGTVVVARPFADIGMERANRLCAALASMAGVEARLAVLPDNVLPASEAVASMAAPAPQRRYRRVSGPPGATQQEAQREAE